MPRRARHDHRAGPIRVLHVDDDLEFADLTADVLEREDDRLAVTTAPSAADGLDLLAADGFDCVVSDYEMPGRNGLEFLEAVREEEPDIPFILYTGRGSEDLASEAISAGVTDYLRKEGGIDQYAVLANRVRNAVERARAERERERHLEAIETAQEGISVLDGDGYFVYVNEAYADLYGYDPGDLLGEHWEILYRAEDVRHIHEEVLPEVRETGRWHGTTTGLRADGTTFVEDHVLARTADGDLVCTVRDVTEAEALREKYELVVKASTDAFWDWDPRTDEIDRSGDYLSQFGYGPADVGPGTDWWRERIHPDDRDRVLDALWEAVEDPEATYDETYRFRTADGSYGYLRSRGYAVYDDTGEAVRMVGAHTDITDQKERERELARSERRYRALAEHLPNGAVLAFDTDLRYRAAHGDIFSETESVPGDYLGNHISEVFDGETLARKRDLYEATLEGRRQRDEMAFAGRVYRVHTIPVRDEEGAVTGGLVVTRDITDHEELERKKDRLEEFTSIVSHDLRNPLNVARGHAELAREDCDSEYLDGVIRAHERMETLIDDLLALARSGQHIDEKVPVDLRTLSVDCWDAVVTDEATLEAEVDRLIRADRNRLRQLLENLFRNAVEHGGPGVTVTVGELVDGFYVADDGAGVPTDERDRIFDAGYSTARDGTGFGLSIVEDVADAHEWSIRAAEGTDGGARFEVTGVEFADAAR